MAIKCIVCKGAGELDNPKKNNRDNAIKILHDNGYSYRQIMCLVGYKSTRSISEALKRVNGKVND